MGNRCDKEGIMCDECMCYGRMFLGCCRKECGEHFYCEFCSKRELYKTNPVKENSDK